MQLDTAELKLVQNTTYPLLKQAAMEKLKAVLTQTATELLQHDEIAKHVSQKQVKISAGENYLNLPYLVADVPKLTSANPHLHIRILFWWGNYFACQFFVDTIQVNPQRLLVNLPQLEAVYVLVSDNIWHNNINDDCWKLATDLTDDDYAALLKQQTIKCCALHAIEDYPLLTTAATHFYKALFNFM